MEGTPFKRSIAPRIIFIKKLFFFAYSFKKIAVQSPMGTEISKLNATVISVVIIDGSIVIFSLSKSYLPKSKCGLVNKCGAPFTKIKPITSNNTVPASTPAVIAAPAPIFAVFILYLKVEKASVILVQKVFFFVGAVGTKGEYFSDRFVYGLMTENGIVVTDPVYDICYPIQPEKHQTPNTSSHL